MLQAATAVGSGPDSVAEYYEVPPVAGPGPGMTGQNTEARLSFQNFGMAGDRKLNELHHPIESEPSAVTIEKVHASTISLFILDML
jgi:hypothetical protein